MKNNQKGITLVSLVVTVIVLIILAGISVGSLSENDGILNQTNNSVSSVEKESAIIKVEAEVYKSRSSDGTIDLDKLNKYLSKIEKLKYQENDITSTNKITELPVEIEINGYNIYIDEKGNVGGVVER